MTLNSQAAAAVELCNHMFEMGAHQVRIPVQIGHEHYTITISKSRSRKIRTVNTPPVEISSGSLISNKQT